MGALNVVITGASGYLGQALVEAVATAGHRVTALSRKTAPERELDGVTYCYHDLSDESACLGKLLGDVDVVIHAAASMSGDERDQTRNTVEATRNLVRQMPNGRRLILISSLSVYGALDLEPGTLVTEDTPLEGRAGQRDAYCRAKLQQEVIALTAKNAGEIELTILRPGAIFGPGRLRNGHLGVSIGPVLLKVDQGGEVPLAHVSNVSEAVVAALENSEMQSTAINIIDDDLPSRSAYVRAALSTGWPRLAIPFPIWPLKLMATPFASWHGRPGLFKHATIAARLKPLRYSNERAKAALDWTPRVRWEQAVK